jgi:TolB-like protein/AraC-like DNA-binding protein/Tfp pilus assembly protein PilF
MTTTLAVLPFVNISPDKEHEYFGDGISEEIIKALARISHLKVTSRTSSFYFKNKSLPIKEVSAQLGVAVVLEGSIRVSGNIIRITAQLIQARDDFHFWAESWDRKLENIFEIQDEISLLIADKLREQFGHMEIGDHLVDKQTEQLEVYKYSLKAKLYFNKWNAEDAKQAIAYWEQAIQLDPKHVESYVGLADAYGFLATTGFLPYEEAWHKTAAYTRHALELNPNHPGAHYQLANISFFTKADFQDAFHHGRKAVELMPSYPEAQQFMAFLYMLAGDMKAAWKHLSLALDIDPLNQETQFYKAYYHYRSDQTRQAYKLLEKCLEHNPHNLPALITKGYCLLMMGEVEQVRQFVQKQPEGLLVPGDKVGILALAEVMASNTAGPYLQQLVEEAEQPMAFQQHSYLFQAYARLGQPDKAFAWLEHAITLKSAILLLGFSDPLAKPLVQDSRFAHFHKQLYGALPQEKEGNPAKQPLLDDERAQVFRDQLLQYMEEEEPFLNPQLSLRSLAAQLELHANQLSWLLNVRLGKNFNEFVNTYRILQFKKLALDPANAHISLLGLAYESGFNSKTVFNTYFKKEVGMTPREFIKKEAQVK